MLATGVCRILRSNNYQEHLTTRNVLLIIVVVCRKKGKCYPKAILYYLGQWHVTSLQKKNKSVVKALTAHCIGEELQLVA